MPKIAGDPLTKVTLNLYEADVRWFQQRYGQGWSTELRAEIHRWIELYAQCKAREMANDK